MTDFIIKKLSYDLTSNAGLALVGQYMNRLGINKRIDGKFPIGVGGIFNSDILKSSLGLLVQGKNDFDAVEGFRVMTSLPARWMWPQYLLARPCASAWTPMWPLGLNWPVN
jgi:hypothetical protein